VFVLFFEKMVSENNIFSKIMESYSWVFCRKKCFVKTYYILGHWGICCGGDGVLHKFYSHVHGNIFFPPPILGIKTRESRSYFIPENLLFHFHILGNNFYIHGQTHHKFYYKLTFEMEVSKHNSLL
jgi:hypothetical protein